MRIRIFTDGDFGIELGELLSRAGLPPAVRILNRSCPSAGPAPHDLEGCDVAVYAGCRDVLTRLEQFGEGAARAERPWFSVSAGPLGVRVGPGFQPSRSPCVRCYRTRLRQHAYWPLAVDSALDAAMAGNPGLGVKGASPHTIAIAAGLMVHTIAAPGVRRRGLWERITLIDARTDETRWWRLIAVEGCPACAPSPAIDRSGTLLTRLKADQIESK